MTDTSTAAQAPATSEASNGVAPSSAAQPDSAAQQQQATPAVATQQQQEQQPTPQALANPGLDDVMSFLERLDHPSQQEPEQEAPAGEEAATAQEDHTEQPEQAEEPEADPEAQAQEEDQGNTGRKDPRIRINPKNWQGRERDYAAIRLADEMGISLQEAMTQLGFTPQEAARAAKAPEQAPAPEPEQQTGPTVESVQQRLAEIKAAKEQARKDFDLEGLDKLNDEQMDLRDQLNELKSQRQAQQKNAATTYQSAMAKSWDGLRGEYPDAFKEGSQLEGALIAEVGRLKQVNPGIFNDPTWPDMVVPSVARKLGVAAKAQPAAAKQAPAPKPGVAKPAVSKPTPPTSGAARSGPSAARTSAPPARESLSDAMAWLEANGTKASR